MDEQRPDSAMGTPDNERRRLPTLLEVLSRRTQSPVDLFAFYVYMRDQQRSVDYLDFWLDVSQHMALCRHYVRELRRSVLYETPDVDKAGSKRSSQILNDFEPNGTRTGSMTSRATQDQRVSAFLRSDSDNNLAGHNGHKQHSSDSGSGSHDGTPESEQPPRPSFMTSNFGDGSSPGDHSTPQHTVNRADIRGSAEKILYTYLLPGSEREIILPQAMLSQIIESIEEHGRDDPEVFDEGKDYVFQAMERDAFPGFLRSKALGNLVPPSVFIRLIVGLLALFGGFWAAFALIFLDIDRATRCWIILPFSVGVYFLACHQYTLDPFMAFAAVSELTLFSFVRVKEPYVKSLLRKRALMVSWWILLITAALVVLFVFVPGKRL